MGDWALMLNLNYINHLELVADTAVAGYGKPKKQDSHSKGYDTLENHFRYFGNIYILLAASGIRLVQCLKKALYNYATCATLWC